jgi:hypothetical protein
LRTNPNSFVEAILPTPYVVLGRRLRPLSLGHYIWLQRLDCAFVRDESGVATRDDVVLMSLVCSMGFKEFSEFLDSAESLSFWRYPWAYISYVLGLTPKRVLGYDTARYAVYQWAKKVGNFDLGEKVDLLLRYIKESTEMPRVWFDKEPKETGGDWAQNVVLTLTNSGFTRDEALEMPFREAMIHFFRKAEHLGAISFMTEEEIAQTEPDLGAEGNSSRDPKNPSSGPLEDEKPASPAPVGPKPASGSPGTPPGPSGNPAEGNSSPGSRKPSSGPLEDGKPPRWGVGTWG